MTKKTLTLKQFSYLFLASLANNSPIIDLKNKNNRVCVLPANFKQNIQNILCAENGWKEEFSYLIDTDSYFYNHFAWESAFASTLKQTITDLKKDYVYDMAQDCIRISFSQKEVDSILSRFPKARQAEADHFARLVGDFIYSREYQEAHHDHSALAVKYMKNLREKQTSASTLNNESSKEI